MLRLIKTREIVESFKSEKIRYIYLEEKGRSIARNTGIMIAKGDYIQFLDADDLLDQDKILRAISLIREKRANAVQCATLYKRENKAVQIVHPYQKKDFYENLYIGNTIPIHSMVIEKSAARNFPQVRNFARTGYSGSIALRMLWLLSILTIQELSSGYMKPIQWATSIA